MMFKTPRLIIRPLSTLDLPALFSTRNDPECARYQLWEKTSEAELAEFIAENRHKTIGDDQVQLAIALRSSDLMIGDLFIAKKNKTLTLGFTLASAYQKQGYMTEALQTLIPALQSQFPECELCALVHPENSSSIRLIEKLAFTKAEFVEAYNSQVYVIEAQIKS